jgi:hypothetical protein
MLLLSVSISISIPSIPIPSISIIVIVRVNFMTNDATDYSSADGSNGAAIRQHGTGNATDTGADRRILVLSGHTATTA